MRERERCAYRCLVFFVKLSEAFFSCLSHVFGVGIRIKVVGVDVEWNEAQRIK